MVILCWKCDWVLVRKNDLPKHIGVITYVLSAILLGVVFFAGIFGVHYTRKLIKYNNKAACIILNAFDDVFTGRDWMMQTKWIGTDNVSLVTDLFITIPQELDRNYNALFKRELESNFENCLNNIKQKIVLLETKYKEGNDFYNSYLPSYAEQFNDMYNDRSYIGIINKGYLSYYEQKLKIYETIKNKATFTEEERDYLNTIKERTDNDISSFKEVFEQLLLSFVIKRYDSDDIIFRSFIVLNKIYFSFFIALPIIFLSLYTVYIWTEIKSLSIYLHITWNILFFAVFTGAVIASWSGMESRLSEQTPNAVNYLLSAENLNEGNSISPALIDTCINGYGDLYATDKILNEQTDKISKYYIIGRELSLLADYTLSLSNVNEIKEKIDNLDIDDIKPIGVDITIKDIKKDIQENNIDCASTSDAIYQKYCTFISDVQNDLSNLQNDISDIINEISLTQNTLTSLAKNIKESNHPISSKIESVLGTIDNLFDLFDCSFLKEELLSYSYYLMQKVNVKYKQISLCAFIGSLFGYLSIFCLLYTIYHFELKAPAPKEPIVKVITMKTSHSE